MALTVLAPSTSKHGWDATVDYMGNFIALVKERLRILKNGIVFTASPAFKFSHGPQEPKNITTMNA